MNKILKVLMMMALIGAVAVPAFAGLYEINDLSDGPFTVGQFKVSSNDVASGTGQNYEVVKFGTSFVNVKGEKVPVYTAFDGSKKGDTTLSGSNLLTAKDQAPHNNVKMGPLWTILDDYGITSASKLVFGFDVNQAGSDTLDITGLIMTFVRADDSTKTFSMGDNNIIRVNEYNGNGSALAELKFEVDLGYDFMSEYALYPLKDFYIEATHGGDSLDSDSESGGFEEYFLSAVFTCEANDCDTPPPPPPPPPTVPEPASMFLLGSGLLGFAGLRKRKK